jgi:hypothetical protein
MFDGTKKLNGRPRSKRRAVGPIIIITIIIIIK